MIQFQCDYCEGAHPDILRLLTETNLVQQPGYGAPVPPQQQAGPCDAPGPHRRSPWMTFPYPVLCVILFLLVGFLFGAWHPAWVIFLTIPLYYWIARIIENDPNYRAGRR